MELEAMLKTFFEAAGPVAASALWQGAVVALGLEICMRLAAKASPADRFRAWAAGFAVVVALPCLPFLTLHPGRTASLVSSAPTQAFIDIDPRWGFAIAGLWIAAAAWRAADLAVHAFKVRALWRRAIPVEDRQEMGFEICMTRELDRPGVIGFFRPRILIPEWLMGRLTEAEFEQVILHEAEHLRRCDDWTNLGQKLALVLFPLNPALAWIDYRLNHERELACDDGVVRATGKPRAYAACLANLAERGLERQREALSLGAWRKRSELALRVHRLLKSRPGLSPVAARMMLGAVGCSLLFGAVELARAPQLVAFVARPVIAQSAVPDLVNRDGRGIAGYRAVNSIAEVATLKAEPSAAPTRKIVAEDQRQADRADVVLRAESRHSAATQAGSEQFVVLTVSEHRLAVTRNGQVIADYDLNPPDAEFPAPGPVPLPIAQLMFRFNPPPPGPAAGADYDLPDTNLQPPPPPIPVGGPWLIFEL